MNNLLIIKLGSHVLDDEKSLTLFLQKFATLKTPRILVHGGGKLATKIGEQLGLKPNYVEGRRITDKPTLDLVTMVYGGLLNKQLVAQLQALKCQAIGLTGADGNVLKAVKRPVKKIDYGFVGDVTPADVNTSVLYFLLQQNLIPVFAPLTHADGSMLNTNADTIASVLAIALSKHFDIQLLFCSDKKGVLSDIQNDDSVIPTLDEKSYESWKQKGVFTDGILPKLENAFQSLNAGVKQIWIGDLTGLFQHLHYEKGGTLISKA